MSAAAPATHDDVNAAFSSGRAFDEPDDRLLEYLRVLCSEVIRSDEVRLLASNRAITLNTLLTRRFVQRENRATTRLTYLVIVLAALNVIGVGVQIWVAVR